MLGGTEQALPQNARILQHITISLSTGRSDREDMHIRQGPEFCRITARHSAARTGNVGCACSPLAYSTACHFLVSIVCGRNVSARSSLPSGV